MPRKEPIPPRCYRLPLQPGINPNKKELLNSFSVLNHLWNKGLLPKDLLKHQFLTLFAQCNGIVKRQAHVMGMHRNTLLFNCKEYFGSEATLAYRKKWQKLQSKMPRCSFHNKVNILYRNIAKHPSFTASENKGLVNLWLMNMPRKLLRTHYALWAIRNRKSTLKIAELLGISRRSLHRIRYNAINKNSAAQKWFYPLKPTIKDWYPTWYQKKSLTV